MSLLETQYNSKFHCTFGQFAIYGVFHRFFDPVLFTFLQHFHKFLWIFWFALLSLIGCIFIYAADVDFLWRSSSLFTFFSLFRVYFKPTKSKQKFTLLKYVLFMWLSFCYSFFSISFSLFKLTLPIASLIYFSLFLQIFVFLDQEQNLWIHYSFKINDFFCSILM